MPFRLFFVLHEPEPTSITARLKLLHTSNMADTATTNDADAAAQRAAEQARLRKERREAKIKAGGSARLERITGAGGRVTGGVYPAECCIYLSSPLRTLR